MKTFIKLFLAGMLLSALLFSYPANSSAAPDAGVGVVVYPRNVIKQYPMNDSGSDSGPAYRLNNLNVSYAPFVLVVKVVGYYESGNNRIRLWLVDDLQDINGRDPTVQTYDRFDSDATKSLKNSHWLGENASAPAGLDWTAVTANTFYVMVIGRVGYNTPNGNPTYTVKWEIDTDNNGSAEYSGSANAGSASTLLAADTTDWYLNWNDNTTPESGDPVSSAAYVELFNDSLSSLTTAPVDGNGYFEMVLPVCDNGTFSAEARSETGAVKRTWVTSTSATSSCKELINAGSGEPTAVRLADFKANTAQSSILLALALLGLLALSGTGLFLAVRTAEIRRKRE